MRCRTGAGVAPKRGSSKAVNAHISVNQHMQKQVQQGCAASQGWVQATLGFQLASNEAQAGFKVSPSSDLLQTARRVPDLSGAQAAARTRPQRTLVLPGKLLLLRRQARHPPPPHAACMPQQSLKR